MGLFDQGGGGMFDFANPQSMALLGMLQGLGQASMPSRLPVPMGAVFGNLAGGALEGALRAQEYQKAAAQNQLYGAQAAKLKAQLELMNKGPEGFISAFRKLLGGGSNAADMQNALTPPAAPADGQSSSLPSSISDPRGVMPMVRAAAAKYGIDPDVAVKVAQSEGLGTFYGDGGTSGGAMQLHVTPGGKGGAVGDLFQRDTGLDPLDPNNEPATIDYAMRFAAQHGWGPWHGAKRAGIGEWQGILPQATDTQTAANSSVAPSELRARANGPGEGNVTRQELGTLLDENQQKASSPAYRQWADTAAGQQPWEAFARANGVSPATGQPVAAQPVRVAQNGPLTSLPARPAVAAQPAPQMPAAAPAGAPQPAPQVPFALAPQMRAGGHLGYPAGGMDPLAIAGMGAWAQAAGLGDFAKPVENYFYNSPAVAGAKAGAEAQAKLPYTPINIRQGGTAWMVNPVTGRPELVAQAPKMPEGAMLNVGPNGQYSAVPVPGALAAIEGASTAQAAGPAKFAEQEFHGPYGQTFLGTRAQLPNPPVIPVSAPSAPGGGGLGVGGAIPPPQTAPAPGNLVPGGAAQRPEAREPTFPVQTPSGPKDVSRLQLGDLFPQGIPAPQAPPGMSFGKPSAQMQETQKLDAERLQGYNKEAAENQKIYQDLAHLHDVLQRGLNTNKLAPLMTEMRNIAKGLGVDLNIPQGADPNDAAVFDKAGTDLTFAAVKKLAGQVKVAEIQGYMRANPALTIPREANYNIINDLLASAKWQDVRSRLATEYAQTGAPLGIFDAQFNRAVPLVDATESYKNELRKIGAKFPEDQNAVGAALQSAREAIAKGAPRDKVIQRLRDNKIDPSGL